MGSNGFVIGMVISQENQSRLRLFGEVCTFGVKMGGRQVIVS